MKPMFLILIAVALSVAPAWGKNQRPDESQKSRKTPERKEGKPSQEKDSPPASKEDILERVEEKLSGVETVQADFIQEKDLAMFKHTMVIKGSLFVENPARIAWHVREPVRSSMVIDGSVLTQWDEDSDQVQKLRLDKNPSFKPMFKQLSGWFAGRYSEVRKRYEVSIESREPLILVFVPKKDTSMEEVLEHVRVVFRDDESYIHELEVLQVSGDKTTFRFLDTRLNESIEGDAWKVQPDE